MIESTVGYYSSPIDNGQLAMVSANIRMPFSANVIFGNTRHKSAY